MKKDYMVSKADEDPRLLRQRFQHYGYLFFKKYVDEDRCETLLGSILDCLDPVITASGGRPILNGEPFFETDTTWDELYPKIQSLEQFHSFFHQPELLSLMRKVSGDDVFVYPMKMARIATPKKIGYETPPHQDAHSHNAGNSMAGIWVALHDVAADMGRLELLPGSHLGGVRPVHEAQGVGGVQCEIYPHETTWHVGNVEQGDVIIFHACTVHRAEPNTAQESVRLSVDTRFCNFGAPVFSLNLEPHHGWRIDGLDWESIYAGWQNKTLQYYWKDYPGLF